MVDRNAYTFMREHAAEHATPTVESSKPNSRSRSPTTSGLAYDDSPQGCVEVVVAAFDDAAEGSGPFVRVELGLDLVVREDSVFVGFVVPFPPPSDRRHTRRTHPRHPGKDTMTDTTTYAWDRLGTDYMDTRDLIIIANEIRVALEDYAEGDELTLEALPCNETGSPDDTEQEAREILAAIVQLEEEGIPDWPYGATLIREDNFTEYAEELAFDIGAVDRDASWPVSYIDWEAAANALKQDYMDVDYRGVTYLVRA